MWSVHSQLRELTNICGFQDDALLLHAIQEPLTSSVLH